MSEAEASGKAPARRLGRGLSALLGEVERDVPVSEDGNEAGAGGGGEGPRSVRSIEIARIAPHPDQPRRHFDEEALSELADSIRERGVIQPIIVRRLCRWTVHSTGLFHWVTEEKTTLWAGIFVVDRSFRIAGCSQRPIVLQNTQQMGCAK